MMCHIFRLVVVHGKNGQRLEKYYLIGSALLAFALVIPPYAAHQYGWDPLEQDCWYTNDDRSQRIAWQVGSSSHLSVAVSSSLLKIPQVGTQTAWTFLTVIGELICSTKVLIFLFRHDVSHSIVKIHVFTTQTKNSCVFEKYSL
jgi:hypothetical protein